MWVIVFAWVMFNPHGIHSHYEIASRGWFFHKEQDCLKAFDSVVAWPHSTETAYSCQYLPEDAARRFEREQYRTNGGISGVWN